jgi:hypothetical protein
MTRPDKDGRLNFGGPKVDDRIFLAIDSISGSLDIWMIQRSLPR